MSSHRTLLSLLVAALLSGCATTLLAPPPPLPSPTGWQAERAGQVAQVGEADFWTGFNSPDLLKLLQQAAAGNLDLLIAKQRLRMTRDAEQEASAMQQPVLRFDVGPVDTTAVAVRDRSQRNPTIYRLGLNASYELDFWGRVSGQVNSAKAETAAAVYDIETAHSLLMSEVARHFFDLGASDAHLGLLQRRIALGDERIKLETARQAAGRIDQQAVTTAQAAREALQAQQRDWQQQRQRSQWQLALLCGQLPESFSVGAQDLNDLMPPTVPAGLPSALLQRRPDVRAAAARLQAAQARIGVARAEQFPQFRLTAELGVGTDLLHRALSGSVGLFGIGPELTLPLYDGGARAAQLDAKQREAEIVLLEYRKAGLAAFADVEQALQAREAATAQQLSLSSLLARQQTESTRLAAQILAGRKSRLDALAADDAQLESTQRVADNTRAQLDAALALHAALGGDWQRQPSVTTPNSSRASQ